MVVSKVMLRSKKGSPDRWQAPKNSKGVRDGSSYSEITRGKV